LFRIEWCEKSAEAFEASHAPPHTAAYQVLLELREKIAGNLRNFLTLVSGRGAYDALVDVVIGD
jgi:hypothetical protein